jgi:aminoglycoside 3-N-acetyltransferase I
MQASLATIQRLSSGDADLAERLNALFGEVFEDFASYQARRPGHDYLEKLLAKEDMFAMVALVREEVVGGLVAYELPKLESDRSEIYIYDLAVRETYRRQGVATQLIRELQEIARARGAWVIYVQADYGDEPALALYRKLGTQEEVLHFDIEVCRSAPLPVSASGD